MTKAMATARVFWTAYKGLQVREQHEFVHLVLQDEDLRRDLLDLAVIESRRHEPARPLRAVLGHPRRRRDASP